jgi:predicted phosphohydrolase
LNLQIISDIHLEFGALALSVEDADLLIAAGDIGVGLQGLKWLQKLPCPVIYVTGNHEYWGTELHILNDRLTESARQGNVRYLENRTFVMDKVRFLGCTLWTDYNGADLSIMDEMFLRMNDFRYISKGSESLKPADLAKLNTQSRQWLTNELSQPFDGRTVVVTHHAPLMRSWPRDKDVRLQYAYCNDLSAIMAEYDIDVWVHGHIHEVLDYIAHGVRVVCNPRGYYQQKEVAGFSPIKCISM